MKKWSTKKLVTMGLLVALQIILSRFFSINAWNFKIGFSFLPIAVAGMLFGPLVGGMTGFVADFIGSLMQFGFNPFFCPPPILYGLFGGLFRWYLVKKFSVVRLGVAYLFPVVLGSILYQSFALAKFYFDGTLMEGILYYLGTRTFQFSIMLVVEVFIIATLMKMNVFTRIGLWPPVKRERKSFE